MRNALFFDPSSLGAHLDARSPGMKFLLSLASSATLATVVHLQYQAATPRPSPMVQACEARLEHRVGPSYRRISIVDGGDRNVRGERLIFIRYAARGDPGDAFSETEACRYDSTGKLMSEHANKLGIERMIDTLTRP